MVIGSILQLLCPCPKEEKIGRRDNDEWISSIILYRNRFGHPNLGVAARVEEKN